MVGRTHGDRKGWCARLGCKVRVAHCSTQQYQQRRPVYMGVQPMQLVSAVTRSGPEPEAAGWSYELHMICKSWYHKNRSWCLLLTSSSLRSI